MGTCIMEKIHVKPSKIFIANKVLTWLHNLSKIGTCLRTAVACSKHDFIPIEVAINCCLHGMRSWLSLRCDTAVRVNPLASIDKNKRLVQTDIWGETSREDLAERCVGVYTRCVLKESAQPLQRAQSKSVSPCSAYQGTCHISFGSCAVM